LALLSVLQNQPSELHLFPDMKVAVSLLIGAVAALATAAQAVHSRRQEEAATARDLDAALVGGATRTVDERDLVDLGGIPHTASPIRASRDERADVESKMRTSWLVCLVGPPSAGKTQTAYAALRQVRPKALIVCPVDAAGLTCLLASRAQLLHAMNDDLARARIRAASHPGHRVLLRCRHVIASLGRPSPSVPAVLWLDGLERFLPKLDVDEVTRFLGATAPDRPGPEPSPAVRLVATLRGDEYERLMGGNDDDAHRLRRLLGLGQLIWLAAPEGVENADSPAPPPPPSVPVPPLVESLRPEAGRQGGPRAPVRAFRRTCVVARAELAASRWLDPSAVTRRPGGCNHRQPARLRDATGRAPAGSRPP
jgi:hypothetical protein